jgi:hypothetical protein
MVAAVFRTSFARPDAVEATWDSVRDQLAAEIGLVGAVLNDMHDEWQAGVRRYRFESAMAPLFPTAILERRQTSRPASRPRESPQRPPPRRTRPYRLWSQGPVLAPSATDAPSRGPHQSGLRQATAPPRR